MPFCSAYDETADYTVRQRTKDPFSEKSTKFERAIFGKSTESCTFMEVDNDKIYGI